MLSIIVLVRNIELALTCCKELHVLINVSVKYQRYKITSVLLLMGVRF